MGKLGVIPYLDELTEEAQAVGSVNTTYFQEANGYTKHIGHNTDVLGLRNVILQSLKPDLPFEKLDAGLQFEKGKVAGFVIGMSEHLRDNQVLNKCFRCRRCCESELERSSKAMRRGLSHDEQAAIYALHKLAVSPVLLVNRDHQES